MKIKLHYNHESCVKEYIHAQISEWTCFCMAMTSLLLEQQIEFIFLLRQMTSATIRALKEEPQDPIILFPPYPPSCVQPGVRCAPDFMY